MPTLPPEQAAPLVSEPSCLEVPMLPPVPPPQRAEDSDSPSGTAGIHRAVASVTDEPATDSFDQATSQAIELLKRLGLAEAVAVFNLLPDDLKRDISRRRAQEILRAAASREPGIKQLPDGSWYWSATVIEIPRQRAKPEQYLKVREAFAHFAVSMMELHSRPFAAVELYDLLMQRKLTDPFFEPAFVRGHTSEILATCGDARLVQLPDKSWWLADRDPPSVHCGPGYHSRIRNESYSELGRFVLSRLKKAGYPMSGPEIKELIPDELALRLPTRNIHHLLQMAMRDVPKLIRLEDKRWWIHGIPVTKKPPLSRPDRLATEAIGALKRHGSLPARKLRRHLSDDIQKAYPSILAPLRDLQGRFSEIVVGDDGICSLSYDQTCHASAIAESG